DLHPEPGRHLQPPAVPLHRHGPRGAGGVTVTRLSRSVPPPLSGRRDPSPVGERFRAGDLGVPAPPSGLDTSTPRGRAGCEGAAVGGPPGLGPDRRRRLAAYHWVTPGDRLPHEPP